MQIQTLSEAEKQLGSSLQSFLRGWQTNVATFLLTPDSGRLNALSRDISANVNGTVGSLLIIQQTGIFKSSENMYLVEMFRRAFGETRSIREAPVHSFTPGEHENCWSMMSLALFNFWDFLLISGDLQILLRASHDECLEIHTRDAENLERLRLRMQHLNFKEI